MITVKKPSQEEIKRAKEWPIWEKEVSEFPWEYSQKETCYILQGHAEVITEDETVEFGKGDWVEFPQGLECKWKITEPIKKHYKFS